MSANPIDFSARMDKLKNIMHQHGIDIVALIPGANMRYLTGGVHYVLERPIVVFIALDTPPVAVIPKLEVPLFARHAIQSQLFSWTDAEGYGQAFRSALDTLHVAGKVVGVEGQRMRFFEGEILRKYAPTATITAIDEALSGLRLIKSADEIALLETAIHISEQALTKTLGHVKVGMSEREVAHILEAYLQQLGSEGLAFDTIVHAGGNSALPHSAPLDYQLQHGDPLIFDFGGTYQGYCADITRVVFVGEPTPKFQDFYKIVQTANAQAREAATAGISAESLDAVTRRVFAEAGFEHLVRHRTGHGLGLEAHEAPYIATGNQQLLQVGMVFTIEPGIYELGQIGVRIEDDMLISEDGARSLTTFSRDIMVVG